MLLYKVQISKFNDRWVWFGEWDPLRDRAGTEEEGYGMGRGSFGFGLKMPGEGRAEPFVYFLTIDL